MYNAGALLALPETTFEEHTPLVPPKHLHGIFSRPDPIVTWTAVNKTTACSNGRSPTGNGSFSAGWYALTGRYVLCREIRFIGWCVVT